MFLKKTIEKKLFYTKMRYSGRFNESIHSIIIKFTQM